MKYKIGDKVVVKSDLVPYEYYGNCVAVQDMMMYRGCEAVIEGLNESDSYSEGDSYSLDIDQGRWCWTDEMLRPVEGAGTAFSALSPDAPVVQNELGGKQSDTPYAFHMLPSSALFAAAKTTGYGAKKYGETFDDRNYTKISSVEHLNHALQHIYAHLMGDTQDEHLAHAIVRLMFAFDVHEREVSA